MKLKKLLLSALALSILSACNETATNTSINNDSIETFAQKKTNKNVEHDFTLRTGSEGRGFESQSRQNIFLRIRRNM